jgi:uncharacterized Zn-binding protein involved in type VI secretion
VQRCIDGMPRQETAEMKPIARVGDVHICPLHGPNAIVEGGKATADGMPIARVGDLTACGAKIAQGSSVASEGGAPIAHLGSATTHGGLITTGSPTQSVAP